MLDFCVIPCTLGVYMEYLRLLYELPAIVAGTTIIAYMSPWKFQTRFLPLVMFLVGLLVLRVPELLDLALALTIPAAWLQERVLGISVDGHEPLKVPVRALKLPKRIQLRNFATRAYPDPNTEVPQEPQETSDDPQPAPEPGAAVTDVPKWVPRL